MRRPSSAPDGGAAQRPAVEPLGLEPLVVDTAGASLRVALRAPAGAREVEARELDLSVAPGARPLLQHAWQADAARIDLLCVAAEPSVWIDDLAPNVLSAATAVARDSAALGRANEGVVEYRGRRWTRGFELGDGDARIVGRHVLGFVGDDPELTLCTIACGGPAAAVPCAEIVASMRVEATFVAPPTPGIGLRLAHWAGGHPRGAASIGACLALLIAAVLLWRRPRPRPQR
jgi:hypothetical protein